MNIKYKLFFLTTAIVIFIDQISKHYISSFLSDHGSLNISRYFSLTLVKNTGICFGLFNTLNLRNTIIFASVCVAFCIILYLIRVVEERKTAVILGLIEGGIIGNLIDRIRIGAVIDFINFHIWPVFNLADSFIVIGVTILIFFQFTKKGKPYAPRVSEDR